MKCRTKHPFEKWKDGTAAEITRNSVAARECFKGHGRPGLRQGLRHLFRLLEWSTVIKSAVEKQGLGSYLPRMMER